MNFRIKYWLYYEWCYLKQVKESIIQQRGKWIFVHPDNVMDLVLGGMLFSLLLKRTQETNLWQVNKYYWFFANMDEIFNWTNETIALTGTIHSSICKSCEIQSESRCSSSSLFQCVLYRDIGFECRCLRAQLLQSVADSVDCSLLLLFSSMGTQQ